MIRAFAIAIACLLVNGPLLAADPPLPRTPIYNPHSKSYFQLFDDNLHPGTWEAARVRALRKTFHDAPGRLAVVDSRETHDFLLRAFDLDQRSPSVWIGLRYWCSARLLQWEEGVPFSPSDPEPFKLWHAQWTYREAPACSTRASAFAPVYYRTMGKLTRWQAVEGSRSLSHYLVEFPTGGE